MPGFSCHQPVAKLVYHFQCLTSQNGSSGFDSQLLGTNLCNFTKTSSFEDLCASKDKPSILYQGLLSTSASTRYFARFVTKSVGKTRAWELLTEVEFWEKKRKYGWRVWVLYPGSLVMQQIFLFFFLYVFFLCSYSPSVCLFLVLFEAGFLPSQLVFNQTCMKKHKSRIKLSSRKTEKEIELWGGNVTIKVVQSYKFCNSEVSLKVSHS